MRYGILGSTGHAVTLDHQAYKEVARGPADDRRPGADRDRVRDRGAAGVVAQAAARSPASRPRSGWSTPGGIPPGGRDAAHRGHRAAQAAEVERPGRGARGHVLGVHRAAADDHRGLRRAVLPHVRVPGIGHWASIGFVEDLFARRCAVRIITFTVIRFRNNPQRRPPARGSSARTPGPPGSSSA